MKKMFFITVIGLLFAASCNDTGVVLTPEENHEPVLQTKAFGMTSESNPNLYTHWENVDTIYLNGGLYTDSPWKDISILAMTIPDNIRTDIKKENGWTMLGHTLTHTTSVEPNYILFYHKRSGILKVFYFCRENVPNRNIRWIIETDAPSSIIPSNTKESFLSDNPQQYACTSTLQDSSVTSASGALRKGWNCFTFELLYGTVNTTPKIHIDAFNVLASSPELTGELFGQVIVPSISAPNNLSSWKSHLDMVSDFAGAKKVFADLLDNTDLTHTLSDEIINRSALGLSEIIKGAVSTATGLLGSASFFISKKGNVINRYERHGSIELTGTIVSHLNRNTAISLNNLDIVQFNQNKEMGVWGLSSAQRLKINKYGILLKKGDEENSDIHYRNVNIRPSISKESIIINPQLLPEIRDYSVSTKYIFGAKSSADQLILGEKLRYTKMAEEWYAVEIPNGAMDIPVYFDPDSYPDIPGRNFQLFYSSYIDDFPDIYVDVTVTIEYNDGEIFSSGRVFRVESQINDNRQEIIDHAPRSTQVIFIN